MNSCVISMMLAALLVGAAPFDLSVAQAGSCCGGGSAAALSVPKYATAVADVALDMELYDGYWNSKGKYNSDPAGSDLRQYRLNLGVGYRFSPSWQAALAVPYVWNDSHYSGLVSRAYGMGDTAVSLTYELLDDTSIWKVRDARDLLPGVSLTASLLIPTGISPYDSYQSSFDTTGRGFYRLDGTLLVEKTLRPWQVSASFGYGTCFERAVNREYGRYVEPYRKNLGDRYSATVASGYTYVLGTGGDALTGSLSYAYLHEADATYDGVRDDGSGFSRNTIGVALSYANNDSNWSTRVGWNHSIKRDGWGENFPATDTITLGVRYVFL